MWDLKQDLENGYRLGFNLAGTANGSSFVQSANAYRMGEWIMVDCFQEAKCSADLLTMGITESPTPVPRRWE